MSKDLEQLRAENARLRRRLSDCIVWMDTREEAQPGMPRLCDMARAVLSADPAPAAGVTVQEAARVLLRSKEARDTAFDKMWIVATEQFSLEATNAGGARFSVTGDVINALWYAGICAIAGENGND